MHRKAEKVRKISTWHFRTRINALLCIYKHLEAKHFTVIIHSFCFGVKIACFLPVFGRELLLFKWLRDFTLPESYILLFGMKNPALWAGLCGNYVTVAGYSQAAFRQSFCNCLAIVRLRLKSRAMSIAACVPSPYSTAIKSFCAKSIFIIFIPYVV